MSAPAHRKDAPASVRCFVLTISDTRTAANDASGDAIVELLTGGGHVAAGRRIVRDDPAAVRDAVQSAHRRRRTSSSRPAARASRHATAPTKR